MKPVNKWIIALTVILPTLLEVLDISVVNVALDHIRGSLSAGVDEATWSITAYLVANAIIIPLTGWLSRLIGRKRYLMASVTLFTISSFLCGSATSLGALVFFRILQGIGGGGLQPLSQAILLEAFPPAQYGIAMAVFGVGVMAGPIAGPVLGGWITDNWSWPWIFYINIPLGIFSLLMMNIFIQDPPFLKKFSTIKEKIDYWGIGLIVVGIGCLQVVLDHGQREDWFSSRFITVLAILSAVSLVLFVIIELRTPEPILNLRVFRDRSFSAGNIIQASAFSMYMGTLVMLPLFLQQLMGYNAFLAGMCLMPGGVGMLLSMAVVGKLVEKVNPKLILCGGICLAAYSMHMLADINLFIDYETIVWTRIVMGIGLGMLLIPLLSLSFSSIEKEDLGNATGIYTTLRTISLSFGTAFVVTLFSRRIQFHQSRLSEALNPFDPHFQLALQKIVPILNVKTGAASNFTVNGVVYRQLMKEAALASFVDTFFISAFIVICVLPLVFFLKRPKDGVGPLPIH
jgi:MFS transporter, DHA2 family, multidrug resistance protein